MRAGEDARGKPVPSTPPEPERGEVWPRPIPAEALQPGALVAGRYRLERMIARGGSGVVFLATQLPLGRPVALKVLVPTASEAESTGYRPEPRLTDVLSSAGRDVLSSQVGPPASARLRLAARSACEFRERFLFEASICARLAHRHIVTVHDYGETEAGDLFMVMELLDGEPLSRVIEGEGRLSSERTCRIALQVARALRAAHAHGIVHRDLKPSNVVLATDDGDEGREALALAKVLDFGMAELVGPGTPGLATSGRPARIVGSPPYMAPEQIRGEAADPRTDVYALGAVMFHMLAGRPPFPAATPLEILRAHLSSPAPDLLAVAPDAGIAPELAALVARALAKPREQRYASMDQLVADLKAAYFRITGGLDPRRTLDGAAPPEALVMGDLGSLRPRELLSTPPATRAAPELLSPPPATRAARELPPPPSAALPAPSLSPPTAPLASATPLAASASTPHLSQRTAARGGMSSARSRLAALGFAIGLAALLLAGLRARMIEETSPRPAPSAAVRRD